MGKRRIPQRIELHSIPKHRSWLNMTQSLARTEMVKRLCEAAVQDDRIVGLVDFGSDGQGRIDE